MKAYVEFTDTFGGESNYSWVERHSFDCKDMSDLSVMRKAKALLGLSGCRGRKEDCGDMISFYPYGSCTVMFITFDHFD